MYCAEIDVVCFYAKNTWNLIEQYCVKLIFNRL